MNVTLKLLSASLLMVALTGVTSAEDLFFNGQDTTESKNQNFGNKIYGYALNWTNALGEAKSPASGDIAYVSVNKSMSCGGGTGVALGGFIIRNNTQAINQGTLYLQCGGLGYVEQDNNRSRPFYGTLYASGSGVLPVMIPSGSSLNVQVQINGDNGAIIEKRGMGTLQLIDGSNWASATRSGLSSFVIKAGQVGWRPTGSNGKLNESIQTFPANHTLVFADDGSAGDTGCSFHIGARDVDMINLTLREEPTVSNPKHTLTSSDSTNVYIRLTGTPGLNPMGFGGTLINTVGIQWNPSSADNEFVFSNSVSTTKGGLRVLNGSMRLTAGASFTQLSLLEVASGKTFAVDAGAGGAFSAAKLLLGDETAKVRAGKSVILSFDAVEVGGETVPDGVYTSADLDWFEGEGRVRIGAASLVDTDIYWERADGPTALEANATTNYLGVRLSGESLNFTADTGALAIIGSGGFTSAGDGATYTWGWPTIVDGVAHTFDIQSGDTLNFTDDLSQTGGTKLYLQGGGAVQFTGAKDIISDMEVTNGTVIAVGDDAVGRSLGTTTFHLTSGEVKGKLDIRPEPGKNVVNIHRSLTFHYWTTGEHGSFLILPADTTVNFYGEMRTSVSPLKPGLNPWPCHWNYSCPATTVVNWYGGMYAALNHGFPGGTHHVWKALTGGDRFSVGTYAKVYLHVAGNKVGAATGSMIGKLYCLAPYALDGRSANQLITMGATTSFIDMGGFDQALTVLHCNNSGYNGAKVTSDSPAFFRIVGNQDILDKTPSVNITNFVQFVGAAGLSMERTSDARPLVLRNTSSSTGTVQVTSGILKFAAPNAQGQWAGKWPNASAAVVTGGRLVLEHKAVFGTNTVMRLSGSGQVEIPAGVRVKVPALEIDGVAQPIGTYGSSESDATNKDDTRFAGAGQLRVGQIGSMILLR